MTYTIINPYIAAPPFTPASIANCKTFLDARFPGVVANQWDDLSGNNNHWTSPAAGNFPTIAAGEATFDGSTDYILAPVNMMSGVTAGEIFIRQKRYADNSEIGVNTGWMGFGSYGDSLQDHFTYSASIYCGFGSTARKSCGNPTPAINVYHTVDMWSAASDWNLSINGASVYSTASNTVGWYSQVRFGASQTLGAFFQGTIKALALFSRKLTAAERANVMDFMGAL